MSQIAEPRLPIFVRLSGKLTRFEATTNDHQQAITLVANHPHNTRQRAKSPILVLIHGSKAEEAWAS